MDSEVGVRVGMGVYVAVGDKYMGEDAATPLPPYHVDELHRAIGLFTPCPSPPLITFRFVAFTSASRSGGGQYVKFRRDRLP